MEPNPEYYIGESASFQQMIDFLATGDGVDVDHFNEIGNKSLEDLHQEISGKDVILWRNPQTRKITRCAQSAKVIITNPEEKYHLLEVRREYANGKIVHVCKEGDPFSTWYSLSETRKRGELPIISAIRGIREELEVRIFDPSELENISRTEVVDYHPSTAYPGLWSLVYNTWFEWHTWQLSTKESLPTIRDNGVLIYREWFPNQWFPEL